MLAIFLLTIAAFAAALVISLAGTHLMRRLSGRWGLIAHPGGHRGHARPTPAGGGVAVVAAVVLPLAGVAVLAAVLGAALAPKAVGETRPDWLPKTVADNIPGVLAKLPTLAGLLGGAIVLHVLGWIDDRKPLSFLIRPTTATVGPHRPSPNFISEETIVIWSAYAWKSSPRSNMLWKRAPNTPRRISIGTTASSMPRTG